MISLYRRHHNGYISTTEEKEVYFNLSQEWFKYDTLAATFLFNRTASLKYKYKKTMVIITKIYFLIFLIFQINIGFSQENNDIENLKRQVEKNSQKIDQILQKKNNKVSINSTQIQSKTKPISRNIFIITPRLSIRSSNFQTYSSNIFTQQTVKQLFYKTRGISLLYKNKNLRHTSFLLGFLYGNDFFQINSYNAVPGNQEITVPKKLEGDTSLWDIELILRKQLPNTLANWFVAVQTIQFQFDSQAIKSHSKLYGARVGLGGFFDISDDRRHRSFSNISVGSGITQNSSEDTWKAFLVTINFGYEWAVNRKMSMGSRYRGQFSYYTNIDEVSNNSDGFFILHGPEIHFSYRI